MCHAIGEDPSVSTERLLIEIANSVKAKHSNGVLQKYDTTAKIYFAVFKFLSNSEIYKVSTQIHEVPHKKLEVAIPLRSSAFSNTSCS